ncbi:MAG: hypothetical protein GQ574_24890 [Crocinitomix sp.]|nr:hypothetical protein [Crocinitomix sp.]
MIKNILFPTDFSENSKNALPFAIDLAKKNGGKLFLMHAYDVPLVPPANYFSSREETMTYSEELILTAINRKMQELITDVDLEGLSYDIFIQEGNTQKEIQKVAGKNKIDLIVMGTLGETANRELFMGSVTKNLIQSVRCPVLAIPGDFVFGTIERIVYTTDLENDESKAVDYLAKFSELLDAVLIILHLDYDAKAKPKHLEQLKSLVAKTEHGKIVYQDIVVEDIIEGIDAYIKENEINMLAITTKTTSLLDKVFHRSLTKKILFHTHIPILAFNSKMKNTIVF